MKRRPPVVCADAKLRRLSFCAPVPQFRRGQCPMRGSNRILNAPPLSTEQKLRSQGSGDW
eukprot:1412688-Rhodomonas_salina.2